jgi:hypothetical protein
VFDSQDNCDWNSHLLSDFYQQFKLYILDELFSYKDKLSEKYTKQDIEAYFSQDEFVDEDINKALEKELIVPTQIVFPKRDSRDTFDYERFLNLFGKIHFNYCEFHLSSLNLEEIELFFQDYTFHNEWDLQNYKTLENVDNVIYQICTFKDDISTYTPDKNKKYYVLESNQFDYTCTFEKKLNLAYVQFDGLLFSTEQGNYLEENLKIKEVGLENCIFNSKIIINRFDIENFISKNTIFENKFEFKENQIKSFSIDNSNFKKLTDYYGSKFEIFQVFKSIFEDFEECKFGNAKEIKEENIANSTYATFLNFRNTTFYSGLNLENTNLKESPNFLKSNIELKHTNRETIRIIKHSFEKIGNIIEENKYFSEEMQKYKEELETKSWCGNTQEKLVFNINAFISDFGQKYIKPIALILVVSILNYLVVLGYESNLLYSIYEPVNSYIKYITDFINGLVKNIFPFKSFLNEGMEFVSLLFGIAYSILIFTVKMHTRRG